ncbi:thioredoxin [Virgibacillus pantothenticus]|uniref:Thioredoxin n=1 Tax=Virgibacillus pantothenticus TaxID=1473 RepID=A0A0L0QTW8_VIRPA|nr:thioredoxin family protein [Virgibacillus pantothenticus]KNE22115.1 thioredoxin [Virgibacillus pantothenticus]MED3737612.1 thioredoxin family protein [Virgibacillus pantothenticus]QTY17359.1 thioredoxin family protein [Virgibacillus pantothenticus]SIS92911.1 Thioredoxin [Virgibacillus pantothenticus]GIP64411.1 thioredoxin [Virgibacillus pantothenticus]
MNLLQWFEKGIEPDTYIEEMTKHKENLLTIYDHFDLPDDHHFWEQVKERQLQVIVLTEDWCGDAMLNIPILLKLAEVTDMNVRMLYRDQNLALMDQYLTNGKSRSIPILIFIDQHGNERTKWGPRAESIQAFVNEAQGTLPNKESSDYQEKFKEMILFMNKTFRDNTHFWQDVYSSLKNALQKAL